LMDRKRAIGNMLRESEPGVNPAHQVDKAESLCMTW
jgi:hypothetical protein